MRAHANDNLIYFAWLGAFVDIISYSFSEVKNKIGIRKNRIPILYDYINHYLKVAFVHAQLYAQIVAFGIIANTKVTPATIIAIIANIPSF